MSNGYDATAPAPAAAPAMPAAPDVQPPALYTVVLRRKRGYACAKAEPVPPEEFGISRHARCMRDAPYCYHRPAYRTQADLIAQGYDEAQIKSLPSADETQSGEATSRDTSQGTSAADGVNRAMRPIDCIEHYYRMAYEEDEPRLYRITTGGDKLEILKRKGKPDIVEVDAIPFAVMTPIIVTHRVFGRSIADLVMDIQKIKTALLRQLLDNTYLANNQRMEVAESHMHDRTLDDLLVNRPGGIVRTKMPGGLREIQSQSIGNFVYPLLEYMDATREWRTGVTKQGQGIDANALQNQTATAVNQIFSAAQARVKLIARIMAETGIRDLFALLHATIRKNDRKANTVRLRNKWVQVDPRAWKTRDDMTINVGLGTGSKDQQVAHLMNVLGIQKEILMAPNSPVSSIVSPKNLYNTLAKLCEKIDLKTAEPYFTDPAQNPQAQQPQAPPPDPNMVKVQGQLAMQGQKMQGDMQTAQQKMQMEAALKTRQQDMEAQLERERIATDAQTKLQGAVIDGHVSMHENAMRPVKFGGKTG